MRTYVIVKLRIAGMHSWPTAPEKYAYLRDPHRHEFHITGIKEVEHLDRDVEFIELKHQMLQYMHDYYPQHPSYNFSDFGGASCEMIAERLLIDFDLDSCEVYEDGENGALVTHEEDFSV